MIYLENITFQKSVIIFRRLKGSDRLCMVVELSMQSCGQILWDSFETNKTILRRIFTEFDRKVDCQNHLFGWMIRFKKINIRRRNVLYVSNEF